jgi:hypothetical protein
MTRHYSNHSRTIFIFGQVWAGDAVLEEVEVRK